jgi:hypothetical protein
MDYIIEFEAVAVDVEFESTGDHVAELDWIVRVLGAVQDEKHSLCASLGANVRSMARPVVTPPAGRRMLKLASILLPSNRWSTPHALL